VLAMFYFNPNKSLKTSDKAPLSPNDAPERSGKLVRGV
jgi:hypothetical protein